MARKPNGVELVISAKDESEKAFNEVIDAFKELEKVAKSGAGLTGLFVGLEKRLDALAQRQQKVNKALGDTKSIQRSLDNVGRFTDVLEEQEHAATRAQQRLSQLEEEFHGIEAAANAARQPSERLVESLAKQEARQQGLAQSIAETSEAIRKSNAALNENAGVDEKAAAAIARQEKAVISAGQAWRETTQSIKAAKDSLKGSQAERDSLAPLRDQATAKLKELQAEFKRLQSAARAFDKAAQKEGAGGAVQNLAKGAQQRLASLRGEIEQQKTIQADLTARLSATNKAIDKQATAIEKMVVKAKAQRTTYTDLKKSLTEFSNTARQEGAARQAADIDRLQKSLVQLQTAYDQTSAKVVQAQRAISEASGPDPKAVAQRDAYQKRVAQALDAVRKEQAALVDLRARLDQTGISTASLASRQKELDRVTTELTQEQAKLAAQTKQLEGANQRAGSSGNNLGRVIRMMGKDTRQSLSYMQRLRGELLSIAATYSGIYAVGGAVRSIYDASVQMTRAESRLGAVFGGDTKAVAEEMKFVREEADRLKISFSSSLEQYTKFVSAIPKGSVPLKQIRFIFSSFAESARTLGISNDDLGGIFVALTQIVSKGTLSMEELRQQLGDRLPGALERTAEGLRITTDELVKLVSAGGVKGTPAITLLANELREDLGPGLNNALQSANAAMADFENSVFDLRVELAQSGFIEVLVEGLKEATKAAKDPGFREGAKSMASALAEVIKAGIKLIQNFDEVKKVLKALAALWVAKHIATYSARIISAGQAMSAFGTEAALLSPKLGALVGKLGAITSALPALAAGFAFGTYLRNEFAIVQKFGVGMVYVFERMRIAIGTEWDKIVAVFEAGWNRIKKTGENLGKLTSDPLGALKSHFFGIDDAETEKGAKGLIDRFREIEEEAEASRARLLEITKSMMQDIDDEFAKKKNGDAPVLIDTKKAQKEIEEAEAQLGELLDEAEKLRLIELAISEAKGKKAAEALAKLQAKVREALEKVDAEIQERSADTLQERLEAIRVEYAKLQRQIAQAGGEAAFPKAQDSIEQLVAIKQVAETEKEISRLIQERRDAISTINEMNELGAITVEEATSRINEQNARLLPQMNAALAIAKNIAGTINSAPISQSVDNQEQVVALEMQRAKKEQLLQLEQKINREMALRSERIQTVNSLVQVGTIGEYEGRLRVYEINRQTNAELRETIENAKEAALQLGDLASVERFRQMLIELSKIDEEIINIEQTKQSFASGFADAFDAFVTGAKSAKEAFRDFAADFLREIAKMITKWLVLKAIQGISGTSSVPTQHTGGLVGQASNHRRVPMTTFAGAVRYHSGGIAGLKPDEVPTILQRGEEVLTENDPRHRNNGAGAGNTPQVQLKIVNAIDSVSVLKEATSSADGVKAFVNMFQANKSTFKSVLA